MFMNKKLKSKKKFNKNLNKPFNIYNFHYFKTLNIFVLKAIKNIGLHLNCGN